MDIPVFADQKCQVVLQGQPAHVPPRAKGWALTPNGRWGDQWCAEMAETLRKRGVNALILTESGRLEFGVVERTEPQQEPQK